MNREVSRLILFAKAPVPGHVKTRLTSVYTNEEAAILYRGWARGIYSRALKAGVPVQVAYEALPEFPGPDWIGNGERLEFFYQSGATLGERLTRAFSHAFKEGVKRVAAIGSDSPGLPVRNIRDAFTALESVESVLGPTPDGGYYLIGMSRYLPDLFRNISWSTPKVFNETLEIIHQKRYSLKLLPEYFDIDIPEDMERLQHPIIHACASQDRSLKP